LNVACLHLRKLAELDVELCILLFRGQTLVFFIERLCTAGDSAPERNCTANLNELQKGHGDDESSHADAITGESFLDLGRHGLRECGVDVEELV
jgi:hypothetical protein